MPSFAEPEVHTVGRVRVTFLADGGGVVDPRASFPASGDDGWQRHGHALDDEGRFITSIGGFLVETGNRKVVVDLGMGPVTVDFPGFGPFKGGSFLKSLETTGVTPAEVTDVLFTHLHLDHVGWALDEEGGLRFPNARYAVSPAERDHWWGGDDPSGPSPAFQKALGDRLEPLLPSESPAPGMEVLLTPGHTPGHVCLSVEDGDERLILLGDVLHTSVQLDEPDWSIAFDVDAELARRSREAMLSELAAPGTTGAALHFADAVFGRLVHVGGRPRWVNL